MVTAVLTGLKTSCYSRKSGVLLYTSTIILVVSEGSPGVGPPPVFLCAFFFWLNSFLAVLKSPFHLCFTSSMVLLATPTALTFSVMAFHVSVLVLFVTLSVNLLCKMPLFASTFSVIIVNSRVRKFGFLFLFSALFPVCSSESMFTRLIEIQKNFVLYSLSRCFNPRQPARVALNFPPNLFVRWESPLLEDLFLE